MARRIEVKVYEADGTTLVRTLTADQARQWLDELDLAGSWSLEVPVDHADDAALTDGRIVRFFLDGTARFAGRIEPRKKVAADPSRRLSGRVVKVGGRGMLSILENGIVYPELGLGSISPEVRYFNFSSKDFDASGWGLATELAIQSETDPGLNPKALLPEGWPAEGAAAYWIWDDTGFDAPVDVGDVYFQLGAVTITNTTDVRFFITGDDGWEFFFDGNRVAAEIGPGLYGKTRYFDLRVVGGQDHTFAIIGTNIERPDPSFNIAAVIFFACELRDGGATLGPPILLSDSNWNILAYPATPPGMTPGKILDVLLTEAQARGTLTEITWDFTAAEDSDGVPWPAEIDLSFPVGKNYLEVVKVLVDEHALDFAFDAATMTLHAYVDRGGTVAVEAVLGPNAGANVAEFGVSKTPPGPNTVLGRSAAGVWTEIDDPTAATAWGRREIGLTLGSAPSDEAVIRQTTAFLEDHSQPVEAIDDLRLEVVPGGPIPYGTFGMGDRITAPDYELTPTAGNRVYSIGVGEDAAGNPIFTPELGPMKRPPDREERLARSSMNPTGGGGRTSLVAPVASELARVETTASVPPAAGSESWVAAVVDARQFTATAGSYQNLTTVGPEVEVTIGASGMALVVLGALIELADGEGGYMSCALSGANTQAADDLHAVSIRGNGITPVTLDSQVSFMSLFTGLSPGATTFRAKYAASYVEAGFSNRTIAVLPL